MRHRNGLTRGALIILAIATTLTACSGPGDLNISNESSTDVTVSTGDEVITVPALGGASILGSGCTPGDVIIEFTSGQKVAVSGPVCPEKQIVVLDGKVEMRAPDVSPERLRTLRAPRAVRARSSKIKLPAARGRNSALTPIQHPR